MLKKISLFLFIFFHLFILFSSGLETHICIHKSGHVSFESISSNGNCLSISEIFNHEINDKQHIHNYSIDPCNDILINKYSKINNDDLLPSNKLLDNVGKKIVYNLQIKQNFEYTSSNIFDNIQKIPIENKSNNIRTFVFLN